MSVATGFNPLKKDEYNYGTYKSATQRKVNIEERAGNKKIKLKDKA
jgi:hypothetical protein